MIHSMPSRIHRIVNGITLYRVLAAPFLLLLVLLEDWQPFKYLLVVSFFTDAIDGMVARRYRAETPYGSRLDSIGDDLTVGVGLVGLINLRPAFLHEQWLAVLLLALLYGIQTCMALVRYRRISNFHTYLAKAAAILQALFLISAFFIPQPSYLLFYLAVAFTAVELVEEIVLVTLLKSWEPDVKGIYWVLKRKHRLRDQAARGANN